MWTQIRQAARAVWRVPASSGAIVLTLALAIGGTTAMFSVVHAVLMSPLPYPEPDRIVRIWERHVPRNRDRNVVSPANFMEWRDRARTVTDLAAFAPGTVSITGDGAPERLNSIVATPAFFRVLGAATVQGRTFEESDAIPNAERVVLISWNLWQRRYGGDPAVVNRSLSVNAAPARVVGILPDGFRAFGQDADVWLVQSLPESARTPRGRSMQVVARLAPGASIEQARAEFDALSVDLEQRWPEFNAGWRISVVSAKDDLVGDLGRPLALLFAAVGLVLLAGCANAANLLIARAAERRQEFEVRAAMGATRGRLIRQLAWEGLVLGATGTGLGLAVAAGTLAAIVDVAGPAFGVPRIENAGLSWPVLGASVALLMVCTLIFALAPGWLASRAAATAGLSSAARIRTGGPVERRVRAGLVVAQIAFAVLLVISAGLVTRSLMRLVSVDPGFDAANVLTLTVSLPNSAYDNARQIEFFGRAADDLRALPGVTHVGAISWIPFGGPGGATSFDVDGRTPAAPADRPVADIRPIDAGYLEAMRIPLLRGRSFTPDEVRSGARVAIVSQDLVRRIFPNEDPIGRRLQVNWNSGVDEIVGVVGDVKINGLATDVRSLIYFPQGAANVGFVTYVVRTGHDDEMLTARPAVMAIQALDPDLPVRGVGPLQNLIDDAVAAPRLAAWLVSGFAGLALIVALVGVAGLLTASVATRRAEFGIRMALGASSGQVGRLVLRQASLLMAIGLVAGLAAALAVSRLMATVLFNTTAVDPATYALTAAAVLALGLAACAGAIRRTARADPAEVLR